MKISPSTLIWILQSVAAAPAALVYYVARSIFPEFPEMQILLAISAWVIIFSTILDKLAE